MKNPIVQKTPKTETPKAPTIISAPGKSPSRRTALEKAFEAGRRTAIRTHPEFMPLKVPVSDDKELRKRWCLGAISVPAAAHQAFTDGKMNGLFGCQTRRQDALGEIWDEGREEGLLAAESMLPAELSYARGFKAGMEEIETGQGPILSEWKRGFRIASSFLEEERKAEELRREALKERHEAEEAIKAGLPAPQMVLQPKPKVTKEKRAWAFRVGAKMANIQKPICPFKDEDLESAWLKGVESMILTR